MALPRWKKLSTELRFRNPWWSYLLDRFRLPGGKEGEYHYIQTPGSAMVVPVTDDGRLLLVNQYRYLCDRESLEFPGGGVKPGQAAEAAARVELAEEAGVQARELIHLGRHDPWNGVTDEMCDVFLARGLVHDPSAHPEETETIENAPLTVADFEARIASGEIWDGMTLAAWCLARKYVVG